MPKMMNLRPLPELAAEVAAYCEQMGWNVDPVSFPAAMALLHEEAAEAGSAWRKWGLEDATGHNDLAVLGGTKDVAQAKPEGVGSEFADTFIRLLDDAGRFCLPVWEYLEDDLGTFGLDNEFLANINALHGHIARVTVALQVSYERPVAELAGVLKFLLELCDFYDIDLQAEYDRKMAYNRTRPYRHGGKRA
jgi:NTP pyrophosphatase (non-canonical NTP hydrolase)